MEEEAEEEEAEEEEAEEVEEEEEAHVGVEGDPVQDNELLVGMGLEGGR